ncbi:hypothetical protein QUF72_17810 [Desulfobacterales bacterium HSG2]|nr:hypothetical protein [Desulfobacterales bacterium HSG2]
MSQVSGSSPLDENSDDRFTYTSDGKIIPSDRKYPWTEKTIEKTGDELPQAEKATREYYQGVWTILYHENGFSSPG